jgi:DNA-directed RNA polymerase I, II, and III subunit RPABC2
MSDIEDGLFNNSDDDNDSDAGSVAESEVDYDAITNDKQSAIKTAPKLNIGKVIVDGVLDDEAEEDDEMYVDGDVESDVEVEAVVGDGDDDDEDAVVDDGETSDDENAPVVKPVSNAQIIGADNMSDEDAVDDDDEDDEDEDYLQKFDRDIKKNYIVDYHPECMIHNYEEISALTKVIRDKDNIIVDPLHRTIPYLTKYERARVLGQRAKQINLGARPFVKVPENIIDGNLVAEMELAQKRIPFILRRPLPGNSGSEYWNLKDLEIITF